MVTKQSPIDILIRSFQLMRDTSTSMIEILEGIKGQSLAGTPVTVRSATKSSAKKPTGIVAPNVVWSMEDLEILKKNSKLSMHALADKLQKDTKQVKEILDLYSIVNIQIGENVLELAVSKKRKEPDSTLKKEPATKKTKKWRK